MEEKLLVNLSTDILIKKCHKKNVNPNFLINYLKQENDKLIHPTFQYRKFMYYFTDYLTVYNNDKEFIGNIRPSYKDFLYNLCNFLNLKVNKKIDTEEELTKLLEERVEILKNIRNYDELEKNFKTIAKDYVNGLNYLERVHKQYSLNKDKKKYYREKEEYYYRCALKAKFKDFINLQVKLYNGFIHNREEYKNNCEKKDYNDFIEKYFDQDKVAMYLASEYLKCCEKTNDLNKVEEYLKLIDKYEKSNYKKDVSLKIPLGEIINQESINERINEQRKRLKEKNKINVNWEIIPPGKNKTVRIDDEARIRRTVINQEEFDRLTALGQGKNIFYENTPYYSKVLGKKEYKGYIGYIYLNGEVLLYRNYQNNKTSTAKGNATYNLKLGDFKTLTKLDKSILRRNPKVGRIIHRDNWQDKVLEIVNKEKTKETEEEVKQYIKTLKEKNY